MKKVGIAGALLLLAIFDGAAGEEVVVHLDVSGVPRQAAWGERGQRLIEEWYPRIHNLLASADFEPPRELTLVLVESTKGVGATSGNRIMAFSNWVEKHPEDFGMLIHELVHVIQSYPKKEPEWVTEGIADYVRWAIYEGKPQEWFGIPDQRAGYTKGYRAAAGFFLWLESGAAPGVVRRLNSAMRAGNYDAAIFEEAGGSSLESLWEQYVAARKD